MLKEWLVGCAPEYRCGRVPRCGCASSMARSLSIEWSCVEPRLNPHAMGDIFSPDVRLSPLVHTIVPFYRSHFGSQSRGTSLFSGPRLHRDIAFAYQSPKISLSLSTL